MTSKEPAPGQEKDTGTPKENPETGSPKAEASPTAKTQGSGGKPAPAAKPKAVPKKPPAKPKEPLVDNGDGTITDPNTGLMWKKKDAWLDKKRFFMWADHFAYVEEVNKAKFAGYDDWRIPSKAEAATLVDKTKQLIDKNGTPVPIDPVFEPGCFASTWISECSEDKIIRFDLKIGIDTPYPGKDIWSSVWLCRKANGKQQEGAQPEKAEEKPDPGVKAGV